MKNLIKQIKNRGVFLKKIGTKNKLIYGTLAGSMFFRLFLLDFMIFINIFMNVVLIEFFKKNSFITLFSMASLWKIIKQNSNNEFIVKKLFKRYIYFFESNNIFETKKVYKENNIKNYEQISSHPQFIAETTKDDVIISNLTHSEKVNGVKTIEVGNDGNIKSYIVNNFQKVEKKNSKEFLINIKNSSKDFFKKDDLSSTKTKDLIKKAVDAVEKSTSLELKNKELEFIEKK